MIGHFSHFQDVPAFQAADSRCFIIRFYLGFPLPNQFQSQLRTVSFAMAAVGVACVGRFRRRGYCLEVLDYARYLQHRPIDAQAHERLEVEEEKLLQLRHSLFRGAKLNRVLQILEFHRDTVVYLAVKNRLGYNLNDAVGKNLRWVADTTGDAFKRYGASGIRLWLCMLCRAVHSRMKVDMPITGTQIQPRSMDGIEVLVPSTIIDTVRSFECTSQI